MPINDWDNANRQTVLSGTNALIRTAESLERSQRTALATEQIGHAVIDDLAVQREGLERSRHTLNATSDNLSQTRKLLSSMHRVNSLFPFCKKMKKIVVGISGGVDSAVAALLLKQRGFKVLGAFMKNWDGLDESGLCSVDKDRCDAQQVCNIIQIPFIEVNFVKQYWLYVFSNLLHEYENGFTPNPDILCNRHIKFNFFVKHCINELKADVVATGHYARTSKDILNDLNPEVTSVRLVKAADKIKDQTFFLSQISQEALKKVYFPLGNLTKPQVKEIAKTHGLSFVSKKRESTGICFIGKRKFQDFIAEYLDSSPGKLIDITSGNQIGVHNGIYSFTIGQSCRIGGFTDKYFVALKWKHENTLLIAPKTNHASLFTTILYTDSLHWIASKPVHNGFILNCYFRFQHTKPLIKCKVFYLVNGLLIILERPLKAITPGQFAVLYTDDDCIGSARIVQAGPSLFTLKMSVPPDYQEYEHCNC